MLGLDTASPLVSVAVADRDRVLARREIEIAHSSEHLLRLVDEALSEAGTELAALRGIVVLRGPGSFTGLRVGLATVLGFRQALGLAVATPSTLEVLAAAVPPPRRIAAVDALRGEWLLQEFDDSDPPRAVAEPARRRLADALAEPAPCTLIGFGLRDAVAGLDLGDGHELEIHEPPPLAPLAARLGARDSFPWQADGLTAPIYFRPPAVTLP